MITSPSTRLAPALIGLAAMLALTAGCAIGPRIYSNEKPGADLTAYSTFGYADPLGTDRPNGDRSILSSYLVDAAQGEMENLGYRYAESDPDLLVNFYLRTEQKIETRTDPVMGPMDTSIGYYRYRSGYYSAWDGYTTTVTEYTEGTLNIDVVDRARGELVWEGVAVGRLRERAREELFDRVQSVVSDVFAKFPTAQSD